MARPEKNHVDYFPHVVKHGMKMHYLHTRYGNNGYAAWYKIMERLATTDYHHLDLSDEIQMSYLAAYCLVEESTLIEMLDFLSKTGWLDRDLWEKCRVVCSPQFLESIVDAYNRRNNECINLEQIRLMYYKNPQSKVKKKRVDKSKEEKGGDNIVFPFDTPEFLEAWKIWKKYKREQFKFSYKPSSEQGALTKLSKLTDDPVEAAEIIMQSIENGWKGLFELKPGHNGKHGQNGKSSTERAYEYAKQFAQEEQDGRRS